MNYKIKIRTQDRTSTFSLDMRFTHTEAYQCHREKQNNSKRYYHILNFQIFVMIEIKLAGKSGHSKFVSAYFHKFFNIA
jgi:hypothetical protein